MKLMNKLGSGDDKVSNQLNSVDLQDDFDSSELEENETAQALASPASTSQLPAQKRSETMQSIH